MIANAFPNFPEIVCLCGSTRFGEAFAEANLRETLAGRIVLSIGTNMKADAHLFAHMSEAERQAIKDRLDALHLRKIELADRVIILNVGGYIGDSTKREIRHALMLGKPLSWLESEHADRNFAEAAPELAYPDAATNA